MSQPKWKKAATASKGAVIPERTTLAAIESLAIPLVQEVVFLADFKCSKCQERVAEIMSRMNETQSVVISVLEKKVTLTCSTSEQDTKPLLSTRRQVGPLYRNSWTKGALILRLLRASCN